MAIIIGGQAIEGPKETISLDDFLEHVQDDVLHPMIEAALLHAIDRRARIGAYGEHHYNLRSLLSKDQNVTENAGAWAVDLLFSAIGGNAPVKGSGSDFAKAIVKSKSFKNITKSMVNGSDWSNRAWRKIRKDVENDIDDVIDTMDDLASVSGVLTAVSVFRTYSRKVRDGINDSAVKYLKDVNGVAQAVHLPDGIVEAIEDVIDEFDD